MGGEVGERDDTSEASSSHTWMPSIGNDLIGTFLKGFLLPLFLPGIDG